MFIRRAMKVRQKIISFLVQIVRAVIIWSCKIFGWQGKAKQGVRSKKYFHSRPLTYSTILPPKTTKSQSASEPESLYSSNVLSWVRFGQSCTLYSIVAPRLVLWSFTLAFVALYLRVETSWNSCYAALKHAVHDLAWQALSWGKSTSPENFATLVASTYVVNTFGNVQKHLSHDLAVLAVSKGVKPFATCASVNKRSTSSETTTSPLPST